MQNMYLSNSAVKKNNLKFFSGFAEAYPRIKTSNFALDLFYSKGNDSIYKGKGFFMANLGVFIYKNEWNRKALKLFFADLKKRKNLKELLLSEHTRGQFCLLLYTNNELKVITDRLGYFPLYCYNEGIIEISNSFLILAKNNKATLDYQGVAEYLSENIKGYACCNRNIVKEIKLLDAGSIYSLKGKQLVQERYYNIKDNLKFGRYNSFNEIVKLAEKTLWDNLSFLDRVDGKIHSDITGGLDTRVIIANLMRKNIKIHYGIQVPKEYKHYTNKGRYSELKIVNQIARHCKVNLDIFSDLDYRNKQEIIDGIAFNMSNKLTYSRRAGYFLRLKKERNINLMISGLSGTELLRQPYIDYFDSHKKMDLGVFLREYYPLVNLMRDDVLAEDEYYDNLKEHFNKELEGLKYSKAEDIGNYIDYFAFYRTHFCRYLALANSILPFYTPYGDFNFATMLYQTSYKLKEKFRIQRAILKKLDPGLASINTTRGFPATLVNITNFYRFVHMISRDIPQQYFKVSKRLREKLSLMAIRFLFSHNGIYNLLDAVFSFEKKQSSKLNLEHRPEISIIPALKRTLSMDLLVFRIVDKNKLSSQVKKDCNFNILTRVLLLNKILDEIESKKKMKSETG